ncbi:SRP40, C-terminal domain-containing protein [Hypoxylon cercidicola]|nr:SRP40, C-terminal domain-containing protein [Hypoxylon cercidicola]
MSDSLHTQSQGPPAWLFSNNVSPSLPSNDTASTTMAKKNQKTAKPAALSSKSTSTDQSQVPPTQLMDLVETFLSDQGFDNAHREFRKHRAKKGWKEQDAKKNKAEAKEHHSLVSVFQTWKTFASQGNTPALVKDNPMEKITKVSSSSSSSSSDSDSASESESEDDGDDVEDVAMADAPAAPAADESSSESSDSSSSDESDSSEDDSSDEAPAKSGTGATKAAANPLKRKAEPYSDSSSSSDSDSDMSGSDSEDERPQTKKVKTEQSSDDSSSSESISEDTSSDSDLKSDSSDSESGAEPRVDLKVAAEVPLPDSDSSSDSDSESDSESNDQKPSRVSNGAASDSSVTLDKTSPELMPSVANPPLPPDPTLKANNRGKNGANAPKVQNQPFSRIRKDIAVDPRLSSNAYVSHGYGEKAHQDLIVTKGKGFTKEKNKKKRGSYKGGPLDIHQSRSIKFED